MFALIFLLEIFLPRISSDVNYKDSFHNVFDVHYIFPCVGKY